MKKFLIVITSVLFSNVAFSQKITKDFIEPETGARFIVCEKVNCKNFKDGFVGNYGLDYVQKAGEIDWYYFNIYISYNGPFIIEDGYTLLLKNSLDDVIELKCNAGVDARTYELVWIGNMAFHQYNGLVNYGVSPEQIEKISKGIKKVRIQHSTGYFEAEYKKDKIGKVIAEEFSLIQEALKTTSQGDIKNGF